MARGDHIVLRRRGYTHHGIDMGDGSVIHYAGAPWRKGDTSIVRWTLSQFAGDSAVSSLPHSTDPDIVCARAESRLGEDDYHVLARNCEHFARWCVEGEWRSPQIATASVLLGLAVGLGSAVLVSRLVRR